MQIIKHNRERASGRDLVVFLLQSIPARRIFQVALQTAERGLKF